MPYAARQWMHMHVLFTQSDSLMCELHFQCTIFSQRSPMCRQKICRGHQVPTSLPPSPLAWHASRHQPLLARPQVPTPCYCGHSRGMPVGTSLCQHGRRCALTSTAAACNSAHMSGMHVLQHTTCGRAPVLRMPPASLAFVMGIFTPFLSTLTKPASPSKAPRLLQGQSPN